MLYFNINIRYGYKTKKKKCTFKIKLKNNKFHSLLIITVLIRFILILPNSKITLMTFSQLD